ncbi:hypothetical protein D9M69_604590 [compost metagenome]
MAGRMVNLADRKLGRYQWIFLVQVSRFTGGFSYKLTGFLGVRKELLPHEPLRWKC